MVNIANINHTNNYSYIGILSLIEDDTYIIEHCVCPSSVSINPGDCFALGLTYCSETCRADGPVAIEHVGQSSKLAQHPVYRQQQLESYIGVPVYCGDTLFGTLNFSSAAPYSRQFRNLDIDCLQLMASWIEVELVRR
ncbi:GAF domain-containing protein [uncultured Photobacterium sp.]|uniref:GAF domain-containing protein n=1 Tax=uncultured Photobacterium sp. TaxID=173973 RepID=UPI00345D7B3C